MAFFYRTVKNDGIGEDQNEQQNESLKRHKVPILKYVCLSLPLFIATSSGLFVFV